MRETCVRYDFWPVNMLPRREGWELNMKKTHRICIQVGYPQTIRVDTGTEFVSGDLALPPFLCPF